MAHVHCPADIQAILHNLKTLKASWSLDGALHCTNEAASASYQHPGTKIASWFKITEAEYKYE